MKECLAVMSILFGSFVPMAAIGQTVNYAVRVTDYSYQSDIKIYVTDFSHQANEKWYVAGACSNNANLRVYVTDFSHQAEKKIYITDFSHQADRKVCITNSYNLDKDVLKKLKLLN